MARRTQHNHSEPLVSIGLCVRNGAEYLRYALDSLLGQTYRNFELIISDNDSTDDTQKISEEYARRDKRIRYIRQNENIGSFGNYDFVRREARGNYFMYAGNDDLWDPRFIEKCLAAFKESQDALVVFPNFNTFDDSGRVMKYRPAQYFPFPKEPYKRLRSYLLSRSQYGKSTIIYGLWRKKTSADKILMDEERSDMIYIFRMLSLGYFVSIPETLLFKRLPAQFKFHGERPKPPLHFLTSLPSDFHYESVDDWLRTRKKTVKGRGLMAALKEFFGDRLQAAKYTWLYLKYIFSAQSVNLWGKIRLSLWNIYAYLRSLFWYGHI